MHNLRDKAAKRAALIKRLKKRVMNEETTTAVESNLDNQTETKASRQTQMIKNCKTYLIRDAGLNREEKESRGELMSPENAENMRSDSETDGVEEVKTQEDTEPSENEDPHQMMLATVGELYDSHYGGNRDGPYSPPSPLYNQAADKHTTVPETPTTPAQPRTTDPLQNLSMLTAPPKETKKKK